MKYQNIYNRFCFITPLAIVILSSNLTLGQVYTVEIEGTDAIYLAGRDDVTIPALGGPFNDPDGDTVLTRHAWVNADFEQETWPPFFSVTGGDVVRVLDPVVGWIHFYNGLGSAATGFGPEGNTGGTSTLNSVEGLSGWNGTEGPLVGVFLNDSNPNGQTAPTTLDFSTALSRDFTSLSPQLSQVFFIGNGVTSGGDFQEFIAPTDATRLFLGIPDGFGFDGHPGAYEDNDGSYWISIGINADPAVPEPSTIGLLGAFAVILIPIIRRRFRR